MSFDSTSQPAHIIRIEPNPNRKCPIQIKLNAIEVSGGKVRETVTADGKRTFVRHDKEVENLQRAPGTICEYGPTITPNGLKTGLDITVENPYANEDSYRSIEWESFFKGKKRVRLQEVLEYKHEKPRGFYTNQISEVPSSSWDNKLPYFQTSLARKHLNDGITFLDISKPVDEVMYYILKNHKLVAGSYAELKHKPEATHYIVDQQEKVERELGKTRQFNKIGAKLEALAEMGENVLQLISKALFIPIKDISKEEAYHQLNAFAKANDSNYEDFMSMAQMYENMPTREKVFGYAEAYDFRSIPGLVTVRNNMWFWSQPMDSKGGKRQTWEWKDLNDFVSNFLLNDAYQDIVDILRSEYRAKSR